MYSNLNLNTTQKKPIKSRKLKHLFTYQENIRINILYSHHLKNKKNGKRIHSELHSRHKINLKAKIQTVCQIRHQSFRKEKKKKKFAWVTPRYTTESPQQSSERQINYPMSVCPVVYICGRSTNRLTLLTVHCTCKYSGRTRETFNVDCLHTTCTYAAQVLGRTLISRKYNFSRDRLRFYFHVLACLSQSTVTCKMRLYM